MSFYDKPDSELTDFELSCRRATEEAQAFREQHAKHKEEQDKAEEARKAEVVKKAACMRAVRGLATAQNFILEYSNDNSEMDLVTQLEVVLQSI